MLLTVYVDDLLLSGPADVHQAIRDLLKSKGKINIEDPDPLDRLLGRKHNVSNDAN